jgi:hypothetical protein
VISRTAASFWKCYEALPAEVQRRADVAYALWQAAQNHPSLQFKCVSDQHQAYSVRIGLRWRALAYRDVVAREEEFTWFWIGSHAEYDHLLNAL